ncbi:MAG TPA: dihydrodipicolinate synthase family protein [Acidobacteriaceae bacterium]
MLLEGIFAAVTSPYYPDGRLYLRKLEHNVERYSRTPLAGMVVLGSTGEAVMLDDAETREVLRTAALAAAPEKVLLAGIGQGSAAATLRLADFAAEQHFDAVLIRTPHYYGPQMSPLAMLTYYRVVADRSPIPVVLYTIPKFTHYDLATDVIAELAAHPNIIGLKDSSGDVRKLGEIVSATRGAATRSTTVTSTFTAVTARMLAPLESAAGTGLISADALLSAQSAGATTAATAVASHPASAVPAAGLKTRTREVGFQVLSGVAEKLEVSLSAGATGAVLAMAACAPQACHEVYIAWKENDPALASEKQQRLVAASSYVAGVLGIAGIKYACELNGYYGGRPRLPLLPLTGEQQAEVARLMRDLRN